MLYPLPGIAFFIAYWLCTEGQSYPEYGMVESCTGSFGDEIIFNYDSEFIAYMVIEDGVLVLTVPDFVYNCPGFNTLPILNSSADDVRVSTLCKDAYEATFSFDEPEPLVPPLISLYPRNYVKLNVKNTLICHVSGFFPPPVRVSWTKNSVNVTDGSTISKYFPNNDRNFNVFSQLSFFPEDGDIYSCSVEHKALQKPLTRLWDVKIKVPSIGPSVFCGVGLTLGLLGFVTGVFFIAKGKRLI